MSETGAHHVSQGPVRQLSRPTWRWSCPGKLFEVGISKHWLSLVYSTLYYLATICNIVPLAKQVAHTLLGNREQAVLASIKKCGSGTCPETNPGPGVCLRLSPYTVTHKTVDMFVTSDL